MSQASRILKSIAATPEYRTLVEALKATDYEAVFQSYVRISELLERASVEVLDEMQALLPRKNKGVDYQRFQSAIFLRTSTILPE